MTTKREERKERADQAKEARESHRRQRVFGKRLLMVFAALAVIAIVFAATRRGRADGRVWSAEHGHWHDR